MILYMCIMNISTDDVKNSEILERDTPYFYMSDEIFIYIEIYSLIHIEYMSTFL